MKKTLCQNIKTKLTALLKDTYKAAVPSNKTEWILFAFFFICYAFFGFSLITQTDILYNVDNHKSGSYLGYDNIFHYKTSGGALDISHPFLVFFYVFKFVITSILKLIFGAKSKIVFCVLLMNLLISSGLIVLYKYLKNIVSISKFRSVLLTIFCGSFFTVIILSFTTESYPFSFLFLILSIYVLSNEYIKEQRFSASSVAFFGFLCGGITITNFIKPVSLLFLNKQSPKEKLIKLLKISIPFVICVGILYLLYFYKSNVAVNDENNYHLAKVIENILRYLHSDGNWSKEVFMDFWSSSVLVAPLTNQTVGWETVLRPSEYLHYWQFALSISLLIIFIFSFFINRKNMMVKFLIFYVLMDVIVHFIFCYGLNEAILFGGHWLFVIPMILSWFYSYFKKSYKLLIAFDVYIICFIIFLIFNNVAEILKLFAI